MRVKLFVRRYGAARGNRTNKLKNLMTSLNQDTQRTKNFLPKSAFVRSAIVAIIVGSVLTLVNQRGAIFGDDEIAMARLFLVYLTPFIVVLSSQALATKQAWRDRQSQTASQFASQTRCENFVQTMTAHGIPMRAMVLGGLMGTLNTLIIITANLSSGDTPGSLPIVIIAQAYFLPVLFGLLSQSIAYRRAAAQFAALAPSSKA